MFCKSLSAVLLAQGLAGAMLLNGAQQANAGQWGCEVLLCAASSDPSWRGISACHPPMNRLISAMGRPGFSWPTCPEAGTGRPGFERYDDCPSGWSIGGRRQEADICTQTVNGCGNWHWGRENCVQTVTMPRPLRSKPYYFDITSQDGAVSRHWFALAR
jgi:hypothetical protein